MERPRKWEDRWILVRMVLDLWEKSQRRRLLGQPGRRACLPNIDRYYLIYISATVSPAEKLCYNFLHILFCHRSQRAKYEIQFFFFIFSTNWEEHWTLPLWPCQESSCLFLWKKLSPSSRYITTRCNKTTWTELQFELVRNLVPQDVHLVSFSRSRSIYSTYRVATNPGRLSSSSSSSAASRSFPFISKT